MMRIAYLVNQYPKISHAFIRREIHAVEREGVEVMRIAIRGSADRLLDARDTEEVTKTRELLAAGWWSAVLALFLAVVTRPRHFMHALWLAIRLGFGSERGLVRHLAYLAEACILLGWLRRGRAEHVHAHFGTNSATVAMLCHALGGPAYSFTAHGPEEFDSASRLGLADKIEHAAFVVAISSHGRSQLYRHTQLRHWPKIKVVRCGVDDVFLGAAPVGMPASRRLLAIGRLCEQKGQLLLVEALARLRAEGVAVEVQLIGDGELRPALDAAIRRGQLDGSVHLRGWADTAAIVQALDESCALVLPSFAEGLPVVIMEAFARARPVLATYVAGIPELVVPGRNGWLVPAGSVDDLALALRQILETPMERLGEMGLRGREDVTRRHDMTAIARELVAHFRAAIATQLRVSEPPATASN